MKPLLTVPKQPEEFVFLLLEGFTHLALSSSIEVLRVANLLSGESLYTWQLMAHGGDYQQSSNGLDTRVHLDITSLKAGTSLYLVSGLAAEAKTSRKLGSYLRAQQRHGVKLGAICSGSYILAEAGLLDGKACTVHWEYYPTFREKFPNVEIFPDAFCAKTRPFTASGGLAGADLMLHLIAKTHGQPFAYEIADQLVLPKVRNEGDVQRMPNYIRFGTRNPILLRALEMMSDNIEEPISTREIADALGVSARQIERTFRRYITRSPGQQFKLMRLEHARNLLATTEMPITEIAIACGFTSLAHFSKTYKAAFGETPFDFFRKKQASIARCENADAG